MPCGGANPCVAAADEREKFPWRCTVSATATATPDCPLCCRRQEQCAASFSVVEEKEMGKVSGGAVSLHLQFAANVKVVALGENMLAELHNDITLFC